MTARENPLFHCLRWTVFILNLIFWVLGIGVLGVAVWLLYDAQFARNIGVADGQSGSYYTGVYLLLAVGILMSIFGFLGCCGALRKSQILLSLFFILLLVVFVIQLVCGILMYYYQEDLKKYVENSMVDAIKHHYGKSPYTEAVDRLQETFQCCGARLYTNWFQSKHVQGEEANIASDEYPELGSLDHRVGAVPASCCTPKGKRVYKNCGKSFATAPLHTFVNERHPEDSFIYPKGCNEALIDYFNDKSNLIIGLAIGIGCLQLIGMVLTMLLCCWISNDNLDSSKNRYY